MKIDTKSEETNFSAVEDSSGIGNSSDLDNSLDVSYSCITWPSKPRRLLIRKPPMSSMYIFASILVFIFYVYDSTFPNSQRNLSFNIITYASCIFPGLEPEGVDMGKYDAPPPYPGESPPPYSPQSRGERPPSYSPQHRAPNRGMKPAGNRMNVHKALVPDESIPQSVRSTGVASKQAPRRTPTAPPLEAEDDEASEAGEAANSQDDASDATSNASAGPAPVAAPQDIDPFAQLRLNRLNRAQEKVERKMIETAVNKLAAASGMHQQIPLLQMPQPSAPVMAPQYHAVGHVTNQPFQMQQPPQQQPPHQQPPHQQPPQPQFHQQQPPQQQFPQQQSLQQQFEKMNEHQQPSQQPTGNPYYFRGATYYGPPGHQPHLTGGVQQSLHSKPANSSEHVGYSYWLIGISIAGAIICVLLIIMVGCLVIRKKKAGIKRKSQFVKSSQLMPEQQRNRSKKPRSSHQPEYRIAGYM